MEADPRNSAGELALAMYADALAAVSPERLIASHVARDGESFRIADESLHRGDFNRILVLGAGKASAAMAAALEAVLGEFISDGLVVTKYGHSVPTERIRILEAAHPVPDESSLAAGQAIHDLASSAGERDLVLFLLSGGASSLMELIAPGIGLDDLRTVTDLLLRAGATINELNAVRACLSRSKAGGVARAANPARLICLVISDVLGDPLDVIGSGPCCGIKPNMAAARAVIERYGLADSLPDSVKACLSQFTSSHIRYPEAAHVIIGNIWTAIEAARDSAAGRGLNPCVLTGFLQGEAREAGKVLGGIAHDLLKQESGIDCFIAGGETTVTVRGQGKGGRSMELACAAAAVIDGVPDIALLAAGTDGTDGPTDAAGALVDGSTLQRASGSLDDALRDSDSYAYLESAAALIKTGPTHTNVNDLVLVIRTRETQGE